MKGWIGRGMAKMGGWSVGFSMGDTATQTTHPRRFVICGYRRTCGFGHLDRGKVSR